MNTPSSGAQPAARRQNLFVDVLKFVMRRWLDFPVPLWITVAGVTFATLLDVLMPARTGGALGV